MNEYTWLKNDHNSSLWKYMSLFFCGVNASVVCERDRRRLGDNDRLLY